MLLGFVTMGCRLSVGQSVSFQSLVARGQMGKARCGYRSRWMIPTRSDACRHPSMMEYAIDRSILSRMDLQAMYQSSSWGQGI